MSDVWAALLWWGVVTAGGAAVWPLAVRLCPFGGGLTVAKALFPALTALLLVWFSTLRLLPFTALVVWLLLALLAAVNWLIPAWRRAALKELCRQRRTLLAFELFGLCLFAFGVYARGHLPGLDSLEKMMNVGFLNSLSRTDYLPAADMWFAGGSINYYYGGHLAVSVWQKLSGLGTPVAYNLAMATVFALVGSLAFQFGHALLGRPFTSERHRFLPVAAGTSTFLLVTLAGNGHAILYDPSSPLAFIGNAFTAAWPAVAGKIDAYWFPSSTRFIGYNPLSHDKTIHEFPSYSFLVADLHAHLINLVFVLAFLLFLLNWFRESAAPDALSLPPDNAVIGPGEPSRFRRAGLVLKAFALDRVILTSAFFLYIFQISNYWDFVMYTACLALVLLFSKRRGAALPFLTGRSAALFLLQAGGVLAVFLWLTEPLAAVLFYAAAAALAGWLHVLAPSRLTLAGAGTAFVFAVSHLLALPFNLHFEPIGKTLRLTEQHTGLYPFLVLWGLMLLLVLIVLVTYRSVSRQPTVTLLLILAACGVVFLLVPEFVYVVDIYGGDFKRANTMFKFTYQAFVLLMLVIGSGPALLLATRRRRAVAAAVLVGLLSLTFLWFPYRASGQWLGPLTPGRYRGIDGVAPLRSKTSPQLPAAGDGKLSDYFALIDWLNKEVAGQPVVLEAFGPSYTDHCLVSAFTGLPTVLGWETHEWLWRTTATAPHAYQTEIAPRQQAIQDFYAGGQLIRMRDFIDRFNVAYVVIGPFETDRFGCSPADPIWAEIGDVAFVSGDVTLLKVFR